MMNFYGKANSNVNTNDNIFYIEEDQENNDALTDYVNTSKENNRYEHRDLLSGRNMQSIEEV
jgi:hypothetical protein